jgi:hypothetical protein
MTIVFRNIGKGKKGREQKLGSVACEGNESGWVLVQTLEQWTRVLSFPAPSRFLDRNPSCSTEGDRSADYGNDSASVEDPTVEGTAERDPELERRTEAPKPLVAVAYAVQESRDDVYEGATAVDAFTN